MSEPRYAYPVLVLGGNTAPPELVAARLDALLAARLADRLVVLVVRAGEDHVAEWSQSQKYCALQLEFPGRAEGGRWTAEIRWAFRVAGLVDGVIVFGDERPWQQVLRFCRAAAVPVRVVRVPAGYVRPAAEAPRMPWAFDPAADPLAQPPPRLDGAGPGGWPD